MGSHKVRVAVTVSKLDDGKVNFQSSLRTLVTRQGDKRNQPDSHNFRRIGDSETTAFEAQEEEDYNWSLLTQITDHFSGR